MASEVISGFLVNKAEPADVKMLVANQAARLLITYPFYGLVVTDKDTGKTYRYITTTPVDGSIPSNVLADWERKIQVFTGAGVPASTLGVNDDIYMNESTADVYKKSAGTWSIIFTISGANILYGNGVPSNGLGADGDTYIAQDTWNVYSKEVGAWVYKTNIKGTAGTNGDRYATVSTTSINLATAVAPLNLTIGTGLAYTVGQAVVVASRANNANNVTGDVVSYNSGSGALVLNNLIIGGTGTLTDWDVNLSGAPGKQGKAFIHTEGDILFNEAKIVAVEAGSWTPENPWSASVQNDQRSNKLLPASLAISSLSGYSIAYDGTSWYNNGRWLGLAGANGAQGAPGSNGSNGSNGLSAYTYIAYASDASGTNFTNTFNATLDYIAIKNTNTQILNPQASDFTGLWKNYKGATGAAGLIPFSTESVSGVVNFSSVDIIHKNYISNADVTINLGTAPAGSFVSISVTSLHTITVTALSIKYQSQGDKTIIYLGGDLSLNRPKNITFVSLGGGLYATVGEVNGALPSNRAAFLTGTTIDQFLRLTTAANGVIASYTYTTGSYFPIAGQGRNFKPFIICQVPIYADFGNNGGIGVNFYLERSYTNPANPSGTAYEIIKTRTVDIYPASGSTFDVRDFIIHHVDVGLPSDYTAAAYRLRVRKYTTTGALYRMGNVLDMTIVPIYAAD